MKDQKYVSLGNMMINLQPSGEVVPWNLNFPHIILLVGKKKQ